MPTRETIDSALRAIPDLFGVGDIVSKGRVERAAIDGTSVTLSLHLPTDDAEVKRKVEDDCRRVLKSMDGVDDVVIMTRGSRPRQAPPPSGAPGANPFAGQAPIEGVRNIIAVSSAKGGVGKSTVCVNLALAMSKQGARVGLMDADVYGPSLHVLLGVTERPTAGKTREVSPVVKHGLKLMSLGFLTEGNDPVIWRGPIVMGVVKKFLQDVEWGELDYLMIDMPPGTGDAQLTLVQTVPLTGAIIVTTPSKLALVDAEKGLRMFRQVHAPVLGIIENMSYFICPHCDGRSEIFSYGGARGVGERLDAEFLGEIPLDPAARAAGDEGEPILLRDPDSPVSRVFMEIATRVRAICPAGDTA